MLFLVWLLAEVLLSLIVARPMQRLLGGLKAISTRTSIPPREIRDLLAIRSRDELEELANTLIDILERAGIDPEYLAKPGETAEDEPVVHDLELNR